MAVRQGHRLFDTAAAKQLAEQYGWLSAGPGAPTHHGEREEFRAKLLELGALGLWAGIGT